MISNHSNKYRFQLLLMILVLSSLTNGFLLWKLRLSERQTISSKNDSFMELKNELQLTDIQKQEFDAIQSEFLKTASDIEATIKTHKEHLNETIFASHPDESSIADLTRYIADENFHLQWIRYRQLIKLKKICTAEQQKKMAQKGIEILK